MKNLTPKLAGTLILLFGLSGPATAEKVKPNYEFEQQFEKVKSVRSDNVNSWVAINDQVLIMTSSPRVSYLVVLSRPDHDIAFSHNISVTDRGGRIMAKFDQVYAMNSSIKIGVPIKAMYKLEGREQKDLAWQLVEEAEKAAKEAKKEKNS